jgi:hypothetical protein
MPSKKGGKTLISFGVGKLEKQKQQQLQLQLQLQIQGFFASLRMTTVKVKEVMTTVRDDVWWRLDALFGEAG